MHCELYMSHQILAVYCVCVYVCVVCGHHEPHSALLTEDSALLLNDKSAKKESMRLQLYKHF